MGLNRVTIDQTTDAHPRDRHLRPDDDQDDRVVTTSFQDAAQAAARAVAEDSTSTGRVTVAWLTNDLQADQWNQWLQTIGHDIRQHYGRSSASSDAAALDSLSEPEVNFHAIESSVEMDLPVSVLTCSASVAHESLTPASGEAFGESSRERSQVRANESCANGSSCRNGSSELSMPSESSDPRLNSEDATLSPPQKRSRVSVSDEMSESSCSRIELSDSDSANDETTMLTSSYIDQDHSSMAHESLTSDDLSKSSRRNRLDVGGSRGLVAMPLYIEWRRVDKGKPYYTEKQYIYSGQAEPWMTNATLDDAQMGATDDSSCAMDAFNAAVGSVVLTRVTVGVRDGPINFDDPNGAPRKAVREAGFDLKSFGKKKPPSFETVLGQRSGVFMVEFYWRKQDGRDWHVVAVNCDQRRVFCNTLGVVPFHKIEVTNESLRTHKWVKNLFSVRSVHRVFRVLRLLPTTGRK